MPPKRTRQGKLIKKTKANDVQSDEATASFSSSSAPKSYNRAIILENGANLQLGGSARFDNNYFGNQPQPAPQPQPPSNANVIQRALHMDSTSEAEIGGDITANDNYYPIAPKVETDAVEYLDTEGFYDIMGCASANISLGLAVILNYEHFPSWEKELMMMQDKKTRTNVDKRRYGTEVDVTRLKSTFGQLHFDVDICNDLTREETEMKLEEIQQKLNEKKQYRCLVLVILSHGEPGFFRTADLPFNYEEAFSYFNADQCPSLADQPKIYIIQACQGDKLDHGAERPNVQADSSTLHESTSTPDRTATTSHRLIFRCSYPDYQSIRIPTAGTWFITDLCDVLDENMATQEEVKDLETLFKEVKRRVNEREAIQKTTYDDGQPEVVVPVKQMPILTSTLLKRIKLFATKKDGKGKTKQKLVKKRKI